LYSNETGVAVQKKICCIDYHDNGYLSVGTLSGDIIIFDTIKNWSIFGGNQQNLKSCVWNEHKKSCHLTVWAKDGSKYLLKIIQPKKIKYFHSSMNSLKKKLIFFKINSRFLVKG
jgi:hypothetical protein